MSRIEERFEQLKLSHKKGLIVYITAGCPDYDTSLAAIPAVEQAGADII